LRQQQPERRFTFPQVITIMTPIVDVITYLHSQQPPIIHRDIKLSNIIVPTSGDRPALVDFGIAKEYDPNATTTAVRCCSPGFSAPEQYTHGTDTRTDIYALGAVFYTLLTGILPIDALRRLTYLGSRDTDPLKPVSQFVPTLPAPVGEAIHRALALNSDERFATVEEFWQAVSAYSAGESLSEPVVAQVVSLPAVVAAPSVSFYRQRQKRYLRKRRPFALLLVGCISLALLAHFGFKTNFLPTEHSFGLSVPTTTPLATCKVTTGSTALPKVAYPSPTAHVLPDCKIAAITSTVGPTASYPTVTPTPTAAPTPTLTVLPRPASGPTSLSRSTLSPVNPMLFPQQNGNGNAYGSKHNSKRHKHRKAHEHEDD
jgi:serine/threonine protein kinase